MQRVRLSSEQAPVLKLGDSRLTLSPKFRLAVNASPELELRHEPLIPGLPDDVALSCLLRLPVESHFSGRAVCKRWHALLCSKERFFSMRRELRFKDPWLFVFAFHRCTGKIQWQVLDLCHFSWHEIPAMPCKDKVCPHGFRCAPIAGDGAMLVCGGMVSDVDCPLDLVLRYEMQRNRWVVTERMIAARSFFAAGVINGTVYVAGGNGTDLAELDSAEAFDGKNWREIAGMGVKMSVYDSAVLDGKLFVTEGWLWPFYDSPRGRVYDPASDRWDEMSVGMREGWTGSSVVVFGRLFVVSEMERMRLKVYDSGADSWDPIEGAPLPEQICKPFSVSGSGGVIYVVGRDLCVAVGSVWRLGKRPGFGVRWRVVDPPRRFSDLTPASSRVLFG